MRRAVTAIYRTYDAAKLVRDELERLGIGRGHISIIPDAERGATSATAGSVHTSDAAVPAVGTTGGAYVGGPPGTEVGMMPGYNVAVPAYTTADAPYSDAFDQLHDLHLPEADTRTYQQAIRNDDYVVSVDVDDDADIARIQEIMRRPEDAYDLNDLDTRYGDADYAPRRRPLGEDYNDGMMGRRDDALSSPHSRYYERDAPLSGRDGV